MASRVPSIAGACQRFAGLACSYTLGVAGPCHRFVGLTYSGAFVGRGHLPSVYRCRNAEGCRDRCRRDGSLPPVSWPCSFQGPRADILIAGAYQRFAGLAFLKPAWVRDLILLRVSASSFRACRFEKVSLLAHLPPVHVPAMPKNAQENGLNEAACHWLTHLACSWFFVHRWRLPAV